MVYAVKSLGGVQEKDEGSLLLVEILIEVRV